MGKKEVKKGSVLGYLWILVGLALLLLMVVVHFKMHEQISVLNDNLKFMAGDERNIVHYVGMALGVILMLVGFMNKPRKSTSK